MDDKVKIRCPACKQVFREKVNQVREGVQVNCLHCNRLITLTREAEDPYMRRSLRTAREMRAALADARAAALYKPGSAAPPRSK